MKHLAIAVSAAVLVAAATSACSSTSPNGAEGAVKAELSAVSANGATYSIPPTAYVTFVNALNGAEVAGGLVGSAPTQTFVLPSGTYFAWLATDGSTVTTDAGAFAPFTLQQSANGTKGELAALLVDAEQTVVVREGDSTTLSFQLVVQDIGTITTGSPAD